MVSNIVSLSDVTKGRIIEALSRAMSEITQAQRLIRPVRQEDGLTVGRQLAMVKLDLALCMEQTLSSRSAAMQ